MPRVWVWRIGKALGHRSALWRLATRNTAECVTSYRWLVWVPGTWSSGTWSIQPISQVVDGSRSAQAIMRMFSLAAPRPRSVSRLRPRISGGGSIPRHYTPHTPPNCNCTLCPSVLRGHRQWIVRGTAYGRACSSARSFMQHHLKRLSRAAVINGDGDGGASMVDGDA
jgi:hypothetical protein